MICGIYGIWEVFYGAQANHQKTTEAVWKSSMSCTSSDDVNIL